METFNLWTEKQGKCLVRKTGRSDGVVKRWKDKDRSEIGGGVRIVCTVVVERHGEKGDVVLDESFVQVKGYYQPKSTKYLRYKCVYICNIFVVFFSTYSY